MSAFLFLFVFHVCLTESEKYENSWQFLFDIIFIAWPPLFRAGSLSFGIGLSNVAGKSILDTK